MDFWHRHVTSVQRKILLSANGNFTMHVIKTLILSMNVGQNLLETVFSIGFCGPTGDKWQSKTLFLAIFFPRSSIVNSVFDCRLSGVVK